MKCHYKNVALVTDKLAGKCCCSVMEELDFCHMRWESAVEGRHELCSDDQVVLLHHLGQHFRDRAM